MFEDVLLTGIFAIGLLCWIELVRIRRQMRKK